MTTPNEQINQYPKYRWIILGMLVFVTMLDLYFVSSISPIMSAMMKTFNTNLVIMGYGSTITTTLMGLFGFIGGGIIGKWGVKKSYIIATSCLLIGNIICVFAASIGILFLGRAFVGIGFGISGSLTAATAFMWFPPKQRPIVFTANMLAIYSVQLIAFNVTVPIYNSTHKVQTVFIVCAILSVIGVLLWTLLGKDFNINGVPENKIAVNTFDGLKRAFKSKQLWTLAAEANGMMLIAQGINFYFPTFLAQVRGFDAATASSITSVVFIAAIIGSISGGTLTLTLGRRKPIIIIACIITFISIIGLLTFDKIPLLIIAMALYGFFKSIKFPAESTSLTEVDGMSPAMAGAANSMVFGFGNLLTFFISPLLGLLLKTFGLQGAMAILCLGVTGISIIASFFVKETGPKGKKAL